MSELLVKGKLKNRWDLLLMNIGLFIDLKFNFYVNMLKAKYRIQVYTRLAAQRGMISSERRDWLLVSPELLKAALQPTRGDKSVWTSVFAKPEELCQLT